MTGPGPGRLEAGGLLPNLLVFGRLLRRLGLGVPLDRMLDAVRILHHLDLRRRADGRDALRALAVRRHEDAALFDQAFDAFWKAYPNGPRLNVHSLGEERGRVSLQIDEVAAEGVDEGNEGEEESERWPSARVKTASAHSQLRHVDFAELTADELREAGTALAALRWTPGVRPGRRFVAGPGPRVDLRRAWRARVAGGGELWRLPTRVRPPRPRGLVLLCDVSGSMERYSRMLLRFAHALAAWRRERVDAPRVEAFVFATALTRITAELRHPDANHAIAGVSHAVQDWSGGTRIGDTLRAFHQDWARRVLRSRDVVLLVSDGWDRGDPGRLAAEVARLQRSCRRLVWLSPLLGTADYAPLTRGLQAALPFVDDFLPARTLGDLEDLAAHLNRLARTAGDRAYGPEAH
jgi:uncharacterized protein with von Willebrand factor type A (vWA) domain